MYRRRFWQLSASAGNCTKKMDQTEFLSNVRESKNDALVFTLRAQKYRKKSSRREQQQRKNGGKKYFLFKNRIYSETFNEIFLRENK